jgi:hypothetical protein
MTNARPSPPQDMASLAADDDAMEEEGMEDDGGSGGNNNRFLELRCVLAVVRHGDRTPKQKMKMPVTQPAMLELFARHKDSKGKQAKLKSPAQLQVRQGACRLHMISQALSPPPETPPPSTTPPSTTLFVHAHPSIPQRTHPTQPPPLHPSTPPPPPGAARRHPPAAGRHGAPAARGGRQRGRRRGRGGGARPAGEKGGF